MASSYEVPSNKNRTVIVTSRAKVWSAKQPPAEVTTYIARHKNGKPMKITKRGKFRALPIEEVRRRAMYGY